MEETLSLCYERETEEHRIPKIDGVGSSAFRKLKGRRRSKWRCKPIKDILEVQQWRGLDGCILLTFFSKTRRCRLRRSVVDVGCEEINGRASEVEMILYEFHSCIST